MCVCHTITIRAALCHLSFIQSFNQSRLCITYHLLHISFIIWAFIVLRNYVSASINSSPPASQSFLITKRILRITAVHGYTLCCTRISDAALGRRAQSKSHHYVAFALAMMTSAMRWVFACAVRQSSPSSHPPRLIINFKLAFVVTGQRNVSPRIARFQVDRAAVEMSECAYLYR